MSFLVRASHPGHFSWLVERTQCSKSSDFRAIEAVEEPTGRIVGMVGFDGWWGNAAQMHVAFETPMAMRALVVPAFDYIFNQAGKEIAIGILPAHNERALSFDKHLGFREIYRVKDGWAKGDDMVVLEMRRDECRWLKDRKAA